MCHLDYRREHLFGPPNESDDWSAMFSQHLQTSASTSYILLLPVIRRLGQKSVFQRQVPRGDITPYSNLGKLAQIHLQNFRRAELQYAVLRIRPKTLRPS